MGQNVSNALGAGELYVQALQIARCDVVQRDVACHACIASASLTPCILRPMTTPISASCSTRSDSGGRTMEAPSRNHRGRRLEEQERALGNVVAELARVRSVVPAHTHDLPRP
jgi:hypothetical protein